jgi:ABC-type branched-subunit amino acid transport system ATPase component
MDRGRKLMEGSPDQVAHDPKVLEVYLGDSES